LGSSSSLFGHTLAEEGMEVEAVADGESALEIFSSSGPFDVVILDVMLPRNLSECPWRRY
jgi:CheY-like chemotaxis protein